MKSRIYQQHLMKSIVNNQGRSMSFYYIPGWKAFCGVCGITMFQGRSYQVIEEFKTHWEEHVAVADAVNRAFSRIRTFDW